MAHRPLVVLVSVRILTSVRRGPTHHPGDSRGPTTEVAERFRRSWFPIISWSGMAHVGHPLWSDTDGGDPQFSARVPRSQEQLARAGRRRSELAADVVTTAEHLVVHLRLGAARIGRRRG